MTRLLGLTALLCALGGCYSGPTAEPIVLEPSATSNPTSTVEVNDVKVSIDARDWHSHHARIAEDVIPIRIAFRNDSDRPVVFRYRDVTLLDASGRELAALPPYALDERGEVVLIERPRFEQRDYELIPRYRRYYRENDVVIYGRSIDDDDRDYYVTSYQRWRHAPTADMLAFALPEGVLKPGGTASGYLYFDGSGLRPGDSVTLNASLYAPDDHGRITPLAKVTLPFEAG